jgi:SAM-dependent methyltransferase
MKMIEWKNQTEFTVDGVNFLCSLDDSTQKTNNNRIIILKDRPSLDSYYQVLGNMRVRNVLEFGILEGGSAVLFTLLLELEKYVGIDIQDSSRGIESFLAQHQGGKNIKFHFGVSQSDERAVCEIIKSEFSAPIDVIIDDASHEYAHTKRSFEIAFPYLRPGGLYVIEDWGWAHWKGWEGFMVGQPAMSMLIFEAIMLCATSQELVSDVRVFPSFAFIRKSRSAPALPNFSIQKFYQKRGLSLGFESSKLNTFYRNVRFRVKHPIAQALRKLNLIRR